MAPLHDAIHDSAMPHVHILMCTWNGARFLPAQLQSFLDQTHTNWSLWVRDDGSRDATLDILTAFQAAHPGRTIQIITTADRDVSGDISPMTAPIMARGSAANFLSLLAHPALPDGYAAFADQDDVWLPHKIERGMAELDRLHETDPDKAKTDRPAVYASRSLETDADLRRPRPSTLHHRPPAFGNALVQNVLGGNTILMNPAAARLMRTTCAAALAGDGVPFHDWWVYLVLTGAGGLAVNDPEPGLLYRQHGSNVIGANQGLQGDIARLSMVGKGRYAGWLDRNLAALDAVSAHLTPAHRQMIADFAALRRTSGAIARRAGLKKLGLHRQTMAGDLLLQALALTGRL